MTSCLDICPVCGKDRYSHEVWEANHCKTKMKISSKFLQRECFSKPTKQVVMERQQGKCASCGEYMAHVEFHHKNGRHDNNVVNCIALCRDCHASQHYGTSFGFIDSSC